MDRYRLVSIYSHTRESQQWLPGTWELGGMNASRDVRINLWIISNNSKNHMSTVNAVTNHTARVSY